MQFLRLVTVLTIALVTLVVLAPSVNADVSGQFSVNVQFIPQTGGTEITPAYFDIVPHLVMRATISGVELGLDTTLGLAGTEYAIFTASGTLGSLDLNSETAFSMPFGSVSFASFTFPTPINDNMLLFVTQRLTASLTAFGVQISNLLIFEDLNFRHPFATLPLGPAGSPLLPTYTKQSQSFGMGDIIRLQGQLPGGATVSFETGLGADPSKSKAIKGRSFGGAVVPGDTLQFVSERLTVSNLSVGVVDLSATLRIDHGSSGWEPTFSSSIQFPIHNLGRFHTGLASGSSSSFPLHITGANLVLTALPLTIGVSLDQTYEVTGLSASANFDLSPQASAVLQMNVSPTSGGVDTFSLNFFWSDPSGVTFSGGIGAGQGEPTVLSATVNTQLSSSLSVRSSVKVTPTPATTQVDLNAIYSF